MNPCATDTRCPEKTAGGRHCGGDLVRPDDGADRMSERLGRIVLQCSKCGTRWSVPMSTGQYRRKTP